MADFNFKQIIRENLYNQQYPHQDKVRIILNEGQTLLLEKKIHEGILDFIKNWGQEPRKDKQDISNLRDKIGAWLDQGAQTDDKTRELLINHYAENLAELPASIFGDDAAVAEIGDSLEDAAKGDVEGAAAELSNVADLGSDDRAGANSDVIDVPAFDMKIMDNILGEPLIKVVVNKFNKMGAALSQKEDQEMVKAFKGAFLPLVANMQKRAHIDIAEGIISEKTKRQLAYMKGQKRKKLGFQAYIKPRKGKESLFVQMLLKDLRKKLIDDVDMGRLKSAFSDAIDTIKDQKVYDQQEKGFAANPERRLQIYKENAEEILNQIKKAADAAAAKALNISGESGDPGAGDDEKSLSASSLRAALSGDEAASVKLKRQIAKSMADSGIKLPGGANPKSPIYGKIVDIISKVAKSTNTPGIKESKVDINFEAYNNVIKAIKLHENKK